MKKIYQHFNLICLCVCGFFLIALALVWYKTFLSAAQSDSGALDSVEEATVLDNNRATQQSNNNSVGEDISGRSDNGMIEQPSPETQELPVEINLRVPFTSQAPEANWDEPWQDACEEAAVLMLDAYYKGYGLSPLFARDEILKMVAWQDERGWGYSIPIEQIKTFVEEYIGFGNFLVPVSQFQIIEKPTVQQIKSFIASGHPVLVAADGQVLGNPYFSGDGPVYHALIIRGYTATHFIVNDPGTKRGENFEYEYDILMNAIHDWNDGDVKKGKSVVLVGD